MSAYRSRRQLQRQCRSMHRQLDVARHENDPDRYTRLEERCARLEAARATTEQAQARALSNAFDWERTAAQRATELEEQRQQHQRVVAGYKGRFEQARRAAAAESERCQTQLAEGAARQAQLEQEIAALTARLTAATANTAALTARDADLRQRARRLQRQLLRVTGVDVARTPNEHGLAQLLEGTALNRPTDALTIGLEALTGLLRTYVLRSMCAPTPNPGEQPSGPC